MVLLFGSTARDTHTINSDVDIAVIWKKLPDDNTLFGIKYQLESMFKKVDLVNFVRSKKITNYDMTPNKDFIDNVYEDGIVLIGDCKYDLFYSDLVGKFK